MIRSFYLIKLKKKRFEKYFEIQKVFLIFTVSKKKKTLKMGSFYSSCSLSHIKLIDERTSIQLLVPGYADLHSHKRMIVANEGPQAFYSPFGFPIHGKYYDYGYLEDIVEDSNTILLEKYFNMSISDIIRYIGRERDLPTGAKNVDLYNQLSMTYFRTEVLEHIQEGWENIKIYEIISHNYFIDRLSSEQRLNDLKSLKHFDVELLNLMRYKPKNYISVSGNKNMFELLPITIELKNDILKQYKFLINLSKLGRTLMPSDYGGQDDNFKEILKLNNLVNQLLDSNKKN